jgi:hypothetical protein
MKNTGSYLVFNPATNQYAQQRLKKYLTLQGANWIDDPLLGTVYTRECAKDLVKDVKTSQPGLRVVSLKDRT